MWEKCKMDEVRRKRKEDESEKRLIAHEDYVRIGTLRRPMQCTRSTEREDAQDGFAWCCDVTAKCTEKWRKISSWHILKLIWHESELSAQRFRTSLLDYSQSAQRKSFWGNSEERLKMKNAIFQKFIERHWFSIGRDEMLTERSDGMSSVNSCIFRLEHSVWEFLECWQVSQDGKLKFCSKTEVCEHGGELKCSLA